MSSVALALAIILPTIFIFIILLIIGLCCAKRKKRCCWQNGRGEIYKEQVKDGTLSSVRD